MTESSRRTGGEAPGGDQPVGAGPLTGDEAASAPRPADHPLVWYAVTVLVLITLNFFLPRAMPGDPVSALMSGEAPSYAQTSGARERLIAHYGLDRPLWEQYVGYLGDLATGEFGTSIRYQVPVRQLVAERLVWTALLIASAIALAVLIGWIAGVNSAWRRGRSVDRGLLAVFLWVHSFPVFFVASLAVFAFAVKLGWFPLSGHRTPFVAAAGWWRATVDVAHHLALPAAVLALQFATSQYLDMRASMVGELGSDYLLGGRAKGVRQRRLKYGYAARNALLPVVALTGVHVGRAVTASILVETVFVYRGLGRLTYEAVAFRDYPTLQACFLVLALLVVTANLLADVLMRRLDPRTRP